MISTLKFHELKKPVRNQTSTSFRIKMQINESLVMPAVLYQCETWNYTDQDYPKLDTFHNKNLRSLLGKIRDEIRNVEQ